jgi:hypothetical protein
MTFAIGARQLVVHDALEMMWCFDASYVPSLTPISSVTSCPLAGAVAVREEARGLEHHVHAEVLPGQLRGVPDRQYLERLAVQRDAVAARLDVGLQGAEHGVVLQQVRERGRIREVVDRDEVDAGIAHRGADDVAPDSSEPVDPNFHGHSRPPARATRRTPKPGL